MGRLLTSVSITAVCLLSSTGVPRMRREPEPDQGARAPTQMATGRQERFMAGPVRFEVLGNITSRLTLTTTKVYFSELKAERRNLPKVTEFAVVELGLKPRPSPATL